jgi:phage baseplate assembly protein W
MNDFLGTDLAVVPELVAHDAEERDLVRRPRGGRERADETRRIAHAHISGSRREAFDARLAREGILDLGALSGRENLAQALVLRLLTPRGSLAALGHAEYGSRLHELIGERKTPALRNLCRAFVLEVVAQEPRVEDAAVEVAFDIAAETPSSFAFTLAVKPRAGGDPLALSLEVGL